MPAISRIRLVNLVFENGAKQYRDETFQFDGHNGVILLENGGGKTVFVQAVLQAVLPHSALAERKARDTFDLANNPLHVAVEWITNEKPRRYALTAVTLFAGREGLDSYKYVYEYESGDEHSLEKIPFVREGSGGLRPASKEEMNDYYQQMSKSFMTARHFTRNREYQEYIEQNFQIIVSEWRSIARINSAEGEIEGFFEGCKTTTQLVDTLLIPTVEEALAGKGSQDFVETFEKQRDHFQKHRQLNERIAESQRVDDEVTGYVARFREYETAHRELLDRQGECKTLYRMAVERLKGLDEELQSLQQVQNQLEQSRRELARKEASWTLAGLQSRMEESERDYRGTLEDFEARRSNYQNHRQRLENLEVSRLRHGIRTGAENMEYLQAQIETLEADPDVRQLEKQLQDNAAFLRYYYQQEETALEQGKKILQDERQKIEETVQQLQVQWNDKQAEYQELVGLKARAEQKMESAEKEMQEIAGRLLANPRHDNLAREMRKWEERTGGLESDRQANEEELSILTSSRQQLKEEIPPARSALEKDRREELQLQNRLQRMEEEHDRLLGRLKEFSPELYAVDSLYLQQNRVVDVMIDAVETRRMEKERAFLGASRAQALFALYQDSSYFCPDPRVEGWVGQWRDKFSYLEAGALFVQKAAEQISCPEAQLFEKYPFWAISLICPAADVQKLLTLVNRQAGELTHPVFILSQEQARSLVQGGEADTGAEPAPPASQVIPSSWRLNLAPPVFQGWKEELETTARQAALLRQAREADLQVAGESLSQLRSFLERYPYEDYRQTGEALSQIHESVILLTQELNKKENRLEEIEVNLGQIQKKLEAIREEHTYTSHRIREGQGYFRREEEHRQAGREALQYQELMDSKGRDLEVLKRQRQRAEQSGKSLEESLYAVKNDINNLHKEARYREVLDVPPRPTTLTRERLELERSGLADALQKKQKDRQALEAGLNAARNNIEQLQRELKRKTKQCEFDIDQDFIFPAGGDEEIDRLILMVQSLKQALEKAGPLLDRAEKEFLLAQDRFQREEAAFRQRFQERVLFSSPLPLVKEMLEKEQNELEERRQFLNKQAEDLAARRQSTGQVLAELEKKDQRYDFLPDNIPVRELPAGAEQELDYQPMKLVARHLDLLQKSREVVADSEENLEQEKKRLESFCREEVRDIRLRENVYSGLTQRDSLEKVEEWQRRLSDRIARAIRHAQDEIREFDRELQTFISHLHTFLLNVAGELRIIPRKTRVKIEEGWKEIFLFDIPEWDEKEGKNELRRHIDWMVGQVEDPRYRDDQGHENQSLLRSDIAKWLQTRQLLRNVMGQKTIKIKCRKVTSDSKVSSYPSSWESSNQWSGGEKWSKNMALFLGILNYLAEKRQAVNPKAQRSRTVVLDNPFGKASSDHVLDPVFFIAEQLGFQIIALTALAEGKFIRDYFPVVYSCRLRPATGDKYIIDSEKEIRYAYFRDRDPEALRRLGGHQQPELF